MTRLFMSIEQWLISKTDYVLEFKSPHTSTSKQFTIAKKEFDALLDLVPMIIADPSTNRTVDGSDYRILCMHDRFELALWRTNNVILRSNNVILRYDYAYQEMKLIALRGSFASHMIGKESLPQPIKDKINKIELLNKLAQ